MDNHKINKQIFASASFKMSTSSTAGAGVPTNPHPIPLTESEVLIRGFLAANPDLCDDKSNPIEIMTDRFTNQEWKAQINQTIKNVIKEVESGERARKIYEGPRMRNGDEALKQLAKTVDHTVLKLDATTKMIDGLCGEARTENFKVCASAGLVVFLRDEAKSHPWSLELGHVLHLTAPEKTRLTRFPVSLCSPKLCPTLCLQPQRYGRARSLRRRFP